VRNRALLPVLPLTLLLACGGAETPPGAGAPAQALPPPVPSGAPLVTFPDAKPAAPRHDAIDRLAFNRAAVRLNLPLYWTIDANKNGTIEPGETATLLFYPGSADAKWVDGGAFTPAFEDAYARIVSAAKSEPTGEDAPRRKLVLQELDQGRATLVKNDLTGLNADDKEFVRRMLAVTALVDDLYATQIGAKPLAAKVPADDLASQSLFRRNWGPHCLEPLTEKNPACSAIPGAPKVINDSYPADIQEKAQGNAFCEQVEKLPNAKALLDPFVVVRDHGGKLEPVKFSDAYATQMQAIAKGLRDAADALKDPNEGPLKAYLLAAAQSFTDDDWTPADEAWAKMNATNSAWFLRIAPDETYWEPCSHKAGFHVTFARINKDSLAWQAKLVPVEQDMEATLAKHIGAPYAARKVTFHLPDFIDILWNAGDDRKPDGATIGQSLPNWGPVANEGRGRTVAMTNLYSDPDSIESRRTGAASLLSSDTMATYQTTPTAGLLNTILHEATHNLGPAHEYKYKGKTDAQWFGGGLASMMEELKAESGAYYYLQFLKQKGIIDDAMVKQVYTDTLVWSFGHISRGMWTDDGQRKPYSQLAAIQVGTFLDEGALTWDPNAKAANGTDTGAFTIHFEKMPAAVDKLMKIVGTLKAKGDRKGAEALAKKYTDPGVVPHKEITERWLRNPKQSFVYALSL
jgi:hypothetical protein